MLLKDAEKLAKDKIKEHQIGYTLKFDNAKRRLGQCNPRQKIISLSKPFILLNEESVVLNTVLHEIAHALVPNEGHTLRWKRKCREIGARPERINTIAISPPMKYSSNCPVHGVVGQARMNKNKNKNNYYCAKCWKEDMIKNYITYKLN